MTTIFSIPSIITCTNGDNWSISWKINFTWPITSCFSINITTYLCPVFINVSENPYMTTIFSIPIIIKCTNGDNWSISWETYWITWFITNCFSINLTAYLYPIIIDIFINPYMAAPIPITIIIGRSNCNNWSISRKTYWKTWPITCIFSINITSDLSPR